MINEKPTTIESPCVRNCCLNEKDICLGCFRHIDEIVSWKTYSVADKEQVLIHCEQRRKIS